MQFVIRVICKCEHLMPHNLVQKGWILKYFLVAFPRLLNVSFLLEIIPWPYEKIAEISCIS